jgi:two-component system chemotaxis response regulator CheY
MPIDISTTWDLPLIAECRNNTDSRGGHMDILLVDDSRTMRMIIQRAIRQAGYRSITVGEAENGAQALEKLRGEKPLLILSDWNMPEMSGIDFLKQVRAAQNDVPFGFITSETSPGIKEIAMDSGATFLISKPFSPEDVQEALTPILGRC